MPEVQVGDVVHLLPYGIDELNGMYNILRNFGPVMCPYPTVVRASIYNDGTQNILRARVRFAGGWQEVLLINGIDEYAEWEQVAAVPVDEPEPLINWSIDWSPPATITSW